ncbi:putative steroid dehydrogenase [Talaromyces proteolyticus]|uniref:Steroid dehydrogenase n=1 Tax=Talaromyces proteolyticus TaxID=1131652 RepID=A0AAD4PZ82_9EURO|nr:putative steroid dehydrogenase [Talaromyces proteolyticus]KAH8695502.1 putative steroid dehydrogenase [Talaromyces proteolyticus]
MKQENCFDVRGQSIAVAGGSRGLGRELALHLIDQGANVNIIARTQKPLDDTQKEMQARVKKSDQVASSTALDLTDAAKVENFVASLSDTSSTLFCVAGGTADEVGFFADISPNDIKSCLERNYLSAAFIAHAFLRRWLKQPPSENITRHIIFTASTAAFVGLPGYSAYCPTKAATRALADTLRQELLLYRSQQDIRVHCTFPGTIYTDAFFQEQLRKPHLLKELEGSDEDGGGLPAGRVAELILSGLKKGHYFITVDSDTALLLNNMRGPSPRDRPVWDWFLGFAASFMWPYYRQKFDRETFNYGKETLKTEM